MKIASKVDVSPERCFLGFGAYKDVIAASDVVLLCTPPHFRPAHLDAAIKAGKHVFAEKPVAVDAPGVRSVLATVELAKKKGLAVVSGLCEESLRADAPLPLKLGNDNGPARPTESALTGLGVPPLTVTPLGFHEF